MTTPGRRVHPEKPSGFGDASGWLPGDYGLVDGVWMCRVPDVKLHLGSLRNHQVIEHEDGTITVSPSILIEMGNGLSWHGYLERGVWRSV